MASSLVWIPDRGFSSVARSTSPDFEGVTVAWAGIGARSVPKMGPLARRDERLKAGGAQELALDQASAWRANMTRFAAMTEPKV